MLWTSCALAFLLLFQTGSSLLIDGDGDTLASLKLQLDQEKQARYELETNMNQLQSSVNHIVESLNVECTLKCPAKESVAFMAKLLQSMVNPASGQVVIFEKVHTNVGNGYNNVHGIFTAPVNGTYNFNIIASVPPDPSGHFLHLIILKNSVEVGYVFLDDNHDIWLRRTTDITQHLVKGDEIWVQLTSIHGSETLQGGGFHTHFSGFLIQAD